MSTTVICTERTFVSPIILYESADPSVAYVRELMLGNILLSLCVGGQQVSSVLSGKKALNH